MMYKLAVLLFATLAFAQDLDSIMLDIYGPDMSSNMITKNSGEIDSESSTEYAHPIPYKHHYRWKRQVQETCSLGEKTGVCKPYYLCSKDAYDLMDILPGSDSCKNSVEICCPK